jgi:hypothetical protein
MMRGSSGWYIDVEWSFSDGHHSRISLEEMSFI